MSFIITSGCCRTGSMNLVFYSLDTCLQQRWNNTFHTWNWMHVLDIYLYLVQLLLNLPYLILLHLCYLYMEDRVILDSSVLFLTTSQRMQSTCSLQNLLFTVISPALWSLSASCWELHILQEGSHRTLCDTVISIQMGIITANMTNVLMSKGCTRHHVERMY